MTRFILLASAAFLALLGGCTGPVYDLQLCGHMYDHLTGQAFDSGTATFRVIWVSNNVLYDSEQYGDPTATVGPDGTACVHGGLGYDATTQNTRLVSLMVRVTQGSQSYLGSAGPLRTRYNSGLEELSVQTDFVLDAEQSRNLGP
jgi:hypothetical protein